MSTPQRKKQAQVKLARLELVAQMYKRGYSYRQIQSEVMKRLELKTYSLQTIHADVQTLLTEWRESRIEDTEDAVQLELARIDETVKELWEQWEKSKEDYTKNTTTRRGAPSKDKKKSDGTIETFGIEETRTNHVGLGNPAYISEIRQQLAERRKLLGLYAPEKKDITGDVSFSSFLVESGLLDEADGQSESL